MSHGQQRMKAFKGPGFNGKKAVAGIRRALRIG
jgi:hypothetical protein